MKRVNNYYHHIIRTRRGVDEDVFIIDEEANFSFKQKLPLEDIPKKLNEKG